MKIDMTPFALSNISENVTSGKTLDIGVGIKCAHWQNCNIKIFYVKNKLLCVLSTAVLLLNLLVIFS